MIGKIFKYEPLLIGKIYYLKSRSSNKLYVGSTTKKSVDVRFSYHKHDYKRYKAGNYNYCSSFEIMKLDNPKIHLIEQIECNDRKELQKKEKEYINEFQKLFNVVNIRMIL